MSNVADDSASTWLDQLRLQGGASPLLIVADNAAISHWSREWHDRLSHAGWSYRVRLGEVADAWRASESAAIADEALRFQARSMLVVGCEQVASVAADAAKQASLPLLTFPPSSSASHF